MKYFDRKTPQLVLVCKRVNLSKGDLEETNHYVQIKKQSNFLVENVGSRLCILGAAAHKYFSTYIELRRIESSLLLLNLLKLQARIIFEKDTDLTTGLLQVI